MGHEFGGSARASRPMALATKRVYRQVEYSPGATHHAADVLSRLPSRGKRDGPIEVERGIETSFS
jgi:hypothetical protein